MKIAVIGATGIAGGMICKVLEERKFPVTDFIPVASADSVDKEFSFNKKTYLVRSIEQCLEENPHIAFFSAGSAVSMEWAPKFARIGSIVIDNSSAWRKHEKVPLIIPEINVHVIKERDRIIAIPGSSTIIMLMALAPLHRKYKIIRIVVSTYQSVTGTGRLSVQQLVNERQGIESDTKYPYPIDLNIIPQGETFIHTGYTSEEMKLIDETHKILNSEDVQITATVVRVPVFGGHSESINVEFKESCEPDHARIVLSEMPGIVLQDDLLNSVYPMPLYAEGKDDVFVGRLRKDDSRPNALNMWVVADNLRKGTATNAVQVAEYILKEFKTDQRKILV